MSLSLTQLLSPSAKRRQLPPSLDNLPASPQRAPAPLSPSSLSTRSGMSSPQNVKSVDVGIHQEVTFVAPARKNPRQYLILDEDIKKVIACFEAVDEHFRRRLSYDEFLEFCQLMQIDADERAFYRCHPEYFGATQFAPLDSILYYLFPSYSQEDVAKAASACLTPAPASPPEPTATPEIEKLFKICGGDPGWGTPEQDSTKRRAVTYQDIVKVLGWSSYSEDQLKESMMYASPQMQKYRSNDTAVFKRLRLKDMFSRIGIPPQAALAHTTPPMSMRNLRQAWETLRGQLAEHLTFHQHCRLSDAVLVLQASGPMAVFRLPWPADLEEKPPVYNVNWEVQRDLYGRPRPAPKPEEVALPFKNFIILLADRSTRTGAEATAYVAPRPKPPPFAYGFDHPQPPKKLCLPRPMSARAPQREKEKIADEEFDASLENPDSLAETLRARRKMTKRELQEVEAVEQAQRQADATLLHSLTIIPTSPGKSRRPTAVASEMTRRASFIDVPQNRETHFTDAELRQKTLLSDIALKVISAQMTYAQKLHLAKKLNYHEVQSSSTEQALVKPREPRPEDSSSRGKPPRRPSIYGLRRHSSTASLKPSTPTVPAAPSSPSKREKGDRSHAGAVREASPPKRQISRRPQSARISSRVHSATSIPSKAIPNASWSMLSSTR